MWTQSPLTWPNTAQTIQTSTEAVTSQVGAAMNDSVNQLTPLISDADFGRHALSTDAEALLGLRDELNTLLNVGTVLTVNPYQFQVGNALDAGEYLSPKTAMDALVTKLRDLSDTHRPIGQLYAMVVMLTEQGLSEFSANLQTITQVLNLPDWCQVARQAKAMSTNDMDKRHQPANIVQPRFKPTANITAATLNDYLSLQGAQIATLESLASDSTNVIDKLSALATKREQQLSQLSAQINALKTLSGSVYSFALSGAPESIASQLTQAGAPNSHQFTIASVLLSAEPLPFFEGLLCSH
jgi:uncharacterized coiled-coil protein SlyX